MEAETLTIETIKKGLEILKNTPPRRFENLYLVHNEYEWLNHPIFKMTQKELDDADEKGFIKREQGIDCYLTRFIR